MSEDTKQHFVFLLASARHDGNTEQLARVAAESLPGDVLQTWIPLMDLPLPPFEDIRHSVGVYPQPQGHEKTLLDATLAATDLVFAAPLYWYSLPASAKLYLDYWSAWLRVPDLDFKNRMRAKNMWCVSIISSNDPSEADPLFECLRLSAEYMQMHWRGTLIGNGSRPGDIARDTAALAKARQWFANLQSPV
jgi:multimeric flavodoxin WrbA